MYLLHSEQSEKIRHIPLITGLLSNVSPSEKIKACKQHRFGDDKNTDTPSILENQYPINWDTLTSRTKKFLCKAHGTPPRLPNSTSTLLVGDFDSGLEDVTLAIWSTRLLSDTDAIDIVINANDDPFAYSIVSSICHENIESRKINYLHFSGTGNQAKERGQLISAEPETIGMITKALFGDDCEDAELSFLNRNHECKQEIRDKVEKSRFSGILSKLDHQKGKGLHISEFFSPGSTLFCQLDPSSNNYSLILDELLTFFRFFSEFPMMNKDKKINITILGGSGKELISVENMHWLANKAFSTFHCNYPSEYRANSTHWFNLALNVFEYSFLSKTKRSHLPLCLSSVFDMLTEMEGNAGAGTPVIGFELGRLLTVPFKLVSPPLPNGLYYCELFHANGEPVII